MKYKLFFNCLFLHVFLSSCLLPPTIKDPKYLSKKEFYQLTDLTEAKNLAKSGRLDAAELLYRKVLKNFPNQSIAKNDLAYILLMQNRINEAEPLLKEIISTEPIFIPARINYARLLSLGENHLAAVEEYHKIEHILNTYSESELVEINGEQISPNFINVLYRLIASAYYLNGNYDDAVCYSQLSATNLLLASEMGLHVRMLLSLEINNLAAQYAATILSLEGQEIPNKINFDYALALDSSNQEDKAISVIDKVLEIGSLGQSEMAAARLLRYSLENKQSNLLVMRENYLENHQKDCKISSFDLDQYWPYNTKNKIVKAQKMLCEDNASE